MADPYIPRKEIDDLLNSVSGPDGDEYLKVQTLLTNITSLENNVRLLNQKANVKIAQIANIEDSISHIPDVISDIEEISDTTKQAKIDAWNMKKAIATTFTQGHPDYIGEYSGLTDADFAGGSVCFILTQ